MLKKKKKKKKKKEEEEKKRKEAGKKSKTSSHERIKFRAESIGRGGIFTRGYARRRGDGRLASETRSWECDAYKEWIFIPSDTGSDKAKAH